MRIRRACAAVVAAAVGLAAGSASAATMMAVYTGVALAAVSYDTTGVFGHADIRLRDDTPYTATFVYDTKLGEPTVTPHLDQRNGGDFTFDPNPILSATFTINGVTTDMSFHDAGLVETTDGDGFHYANVGDFLGTPTESIAEAIYMFGYGQPEARLTSPFSSAITGGFGNAYVHRRNLVTGNFIAEAAMTLRPTFLTVSVVKADVPEPATWALMLIGFGAAGAGLRRARGRFRPSRPGRPSTRAASI
jgi:hypothetical protein